MTLDQGPGEPGAEFGFEDSGAWMGHLRAALQREPLGHMGQYELLAEVGRGGQGIVYRARQPGTQRDIALKRLLAGSLATDEMLGRFRREVEAVSSLHHPSVVSVYGLEIIDGTPVLAMEWVDGVPVTEWARGEGCASRAPDELLQMFLLVCDGVQHAHQHGVVHRDLKPSNILVAADGRPRILDFGLAKVLRPDGAATELTRSGGFLGTPAYAAPEQIEGGAAAADVRSDVYSLGVILYEMATGARPYRPELGIREYLAALDRESAPRPSTLRRGLDGEIDAIVLKALAREPGDRFQSVAMLADDVRRHLAGAPVLAHPPSTLYELRKFVRRNRLVVTLSAALLMTSLLAGGFAWWQAGVIASERDAEAAARADAEAAEGRATAAAAQAKRAESAATIAAQEARHAESAMRAEAERSAALADFFLEDLVAAVEPLGQRKDVTLREAIDHAAERIETRFADRPRLDAAVRGQVGSIYYALGRFGDAARHLRLGLERLQEVQPPDLEAVVQLEYKLGLSLREQLQTDAGIEMLERALAHHAAAGGVDHTMAAALHRAVAYALAHSGRMEDAVVRFRAGLAFVERHRPDDAAERSQHLLGLALALAHLGQRVEARALYEEALEMAKQGYGQSSVQVADALGFLSDLDQAEGSLHDARRRSRESLDILRAIYGDDHPKLASALGDLGELLTGDDDRAEGIRLLREAIAISVKLRGAGSLITRMHEARLAKLLALDGEHATAERLLVDALRAFVRLDRHSRWPYFARLELARVYHALGQWDRAIEQSELVLEYARAPDARLDLGPVLMIHARGLGGRGEHRQAGALIDEAFRRIVLDAVPDAHRRRLRWLAHLRDLQGWGDDRAVAQWRALGEAQRLREDD